MLQSAIDVLLMLVFLVRLFCPEVNSTGSGAMICSERLLFIPWHLSGLSLRENIKLAAASLSIVWPQYPSWVYRQSESSISQWHWSTSIVPISIFSSWKEWRMTSLRIDVVPEKILIILHSVSVVILSMACIILWKLSLSWRFDDHSLPLAKASSKRHDERYLEQANLALKYRTWAFFWFAYLISRIAWFVKRKRGGVSGRVWNCNHGCVPWPFLSDVLFFLNTNLRWDTGLRRSELVLIKVARKSRIYFGAFEKMSGFMPRYCWPPMTSESAFKRTPQNRSTLSARCDH